ncbi:YfjI family protein [Priestia megaterium]|uniref:YfjI family protein n=1 Tax=Priestia megaterium TaxID=1404 RepID=UPI003D057EBC
MQGNEKKVALWEEQPSSKILTNNSVSQKAQYSSENVDILDKELKREAQTLNISKTKSFPVKLFPKPIVRFIEDTATSLSCSPDFIALGVIVCASVAIGNGAVLQVKKSWITGASIYCGVVAEPGSAKTPAINKALKPLFDLQKRNFEEYESKKTQYQLEQDNYDIEIERWKRDVKGKKERNLDGKPEQPNKPVVEQLITMDSTMEALQEILLSNKRGVIKLHDELLGFVKGMNQYRSGADRQYWLSIWSNEPIIINRKGKDPLQIPKPFVSILGGIQPDMIEEILKLGREGTANDGFIDRFLFCYPDSVPSKWTEKDVSEEVVKGYCEIIHRIYYSLTESKPKVIEFNDKAKECFALWYDGTEEETTEADFPETLKGVWRKLKGLHPRILIIMSMLKWASESSSVKVGLIEEETVIYTNYIMDYFKDQAKKVFQISHSNFEDKNAIKLMEYVRSKGKEHEKGLSIRVNALNRGKVFGRYTKIEAILETINNIEAQGLGEMQQYLYKSNLVREFVLYKHVI